MTKPKKDKYGRYRKNLTLGRKPDGSYIRKTVYGKTQKELEQRVLALTQELNHGIQVWESTMTFRDLANLWFDEYHADENERWRYSQAGVKVLHKNYSVTVELVPAFYCKSCQKYYLLESDYQKLNHSGILLCNVVEQRYWINQGKTIDYYITNQESLLHKMGYNVSASNGLSQNERVSILRAALDSGLLTKAEIISHLDYLIHRSRNNIALSSAVEKWKQDREYVQRLSKFHSKVYVNARTIVHKASKNKRKK